MNPVWPLIITVFLGIFHLLGGAALGQGWRALERDSSTATFFFAWGAGMGLLPLVFDWFFLIRMGNWVYGLVGPVILIVSTLASAFLEVKVDGFAVMSAALGTTAFLLGILAIPLVLDTFRTKETVGFEDYVGGSCMVLLFVVIGGAFAWNGFSAMLRGISLDQEYSEHLQKQQTHKKRDK